MSAPSPSLNEYTSKFNTTCSNLFSKTPYKWQMDVGASMLRSIHSTDAATIYQLCVHPTGGGKSLLFTTLAASLGHITLCITPLLSLSADQTIKHDQKNTISGQNEINSVHLDKIPKGDVSEFITLCQATIDSFSTIIYASPQALITKDGPSSFLKFLLDHKHFLKQMEDACLQVRDRTTYITSALKFRGPSLKKKSMAGNELFDFNMPIGSQPYLTHFFLLR